MKNKLLKYQKRLCLAYLIMFLIFLTLGIIAKSTGNKELMYIGFAISLNFTLISLAFYFILFREGIKLTRLYNEILWKRASFIVLLSGILITIIVCYIKAKDNIIVSISANLPAVSILILLATIKFSRWKVEFEFLLRDLSIKNSKEYSVNLNKFKDFVREKKNVEKLIKYYNKTKLDLEDVKEFLNFRKKNLDCYKAAKRELEKAILADNKYERKVALVKAENFISTVTEEDFLEKYKYYKSSEKVNRIIGE